jgi:prophage regulatory protein
MKNTNLMRFLRLPEVIQISGYRRTTIYEMIKAGNFPAPVHLGPRAVAWLESEVEAWMQERIDARDQAA